MVKLKLALKATLENVTDLRPSSEDYTYFVKSHRKCFVIQKSISSELRDIVHSLTMQDEREMSGSRGTANFVFRCNFCKREASAVFDDPKGKKPEAAVHTLERAEKNESSTLVVFECRGCEFTGFEARGSWTCKGAESGTLFQSFEFEDGRWDDYDEKAALPTSITDISAEFKRT